MRRFLTAALAALLLAGCGNANSKTTSNAKTNATSQPVASGKPTAADLRHGVLIALRANHTLAVRVLWTNKVPANAKRSTRGPALAGIRASANDRQRKHLRVRMLHDDYRIISIRLDPSYTSATAVVQWNQDVAPSHLDGTRIGRAIQLHERARILLHRIGSSRSFAVWKVNLVQ